MALISIKLSKNSGGRRRRTIHIGGHKGGAIFQRYGTNIMMRSMPSHYRDANSPLQQPCRNKMKWVMQMHAVLKEAYRGCFEGEKSDYHQFRSRNLNSEIGHCCISHGSLPPLNTRVEGNRLLLDLHPGDWRSGDILRFISLPADLQQPATVRDISGSSIGSDSSGSSCSGSSCSGSSDSGGIGGSGGSGSPISPIGPIGLTANQLTTEPLPAGYYGFVHLRPSARRPRASTQYLLQIE